MTRRLLFVAGGPAQLDGVRKAQALGYQVHVLDGDAQAPCFALADHAAVVDIRDPAAVVEYARVHAVHGVVAIACEVALPAVAAVCHALGLPGLSPEQTRRVTNKYDMRQAWQKAGLRNPKFRLCHSAREAQEAGNEIGFPVVVKPCDSSGSRGVQKIDAAFALAAAYDLARSHSSSPAILVEEFIEGEEASFEAFVEGSTVRVIAISFKERTPPPFLMDTSVNFPAGDADPRADMIHEFGIAAAQALGVCNVPIHLELLMTPTGPVPVEIAARGAGFGVYSEILPLICGVDLTSYQLQLAMGEAPALAPFAPPATRPAVVLRFVYAQEQGHVIAMQVDQARRVRGVLDVTSYKQAGAPVAPAQSGSDRLARIITSAGDLPAARAIADQAMVDLRVELGP